MKNDMKNKKHLRAIGDIDDRFFDEAQILWAQKMLGRKKRIPRVVMVVVCVIVLIALAVMLAVVYAL